MSVPGTLRYGNLLVKGSHQLLNISIIIIALLKVINDYFKTKYIQVH